jgi:large subunit ribosomal protein L20
MSRVRKSVPSRNYRKKVLKAAKGFYGRSKNCYSIAIQKVEKGGQYAYRDRRVKKRSFRALWIVRINAALRELNLKYSIFASKLKTSKIDINRKVLANLAHNDPNVFRNLVEKIMDQKA